MIDDDECNFDSAGEEFAELDDVDEGLGLVFNATGCGECHIAPASAAAARSPSAGPGSSTAPRSSSIPAAR